MDTATVEPITPDEFKSLEDEVREIHAGISSLIESHNRILEMLEKLEGQISPTIAAMSQGPIGKLMGL